MNTFKHFRVSQQGDVLTLQLVDTTIFDNLITFELDEELEQVVAQFQPSRVLVDLLMVKACSTAVINSLNNIQRKLQQRDGQMRLARPGDFVRGELIVLNMDGTVFDVHASLAEAMDSFDAANWRPEPVGSCSGRPAVSQFLATAVSAASGRRVFCDITVEALVEDALGPLADAQVQFEFQGSMNRRRFENTGADGWVRASFTDESKNAMNHAARCRIVLGDGEEVVAETSALSWASQAATLTHARSK